MAPTPRRTPGLLLRSGIWHIDKILYGRRICESTGTGDLAEAQALLARRVTEARRIHLFGEQREHTFREAVTKFLAENRHKRSLERDERALALLDPFIGALPLQRVHHDTLAPFIRSRLAAGRSPGTVNRDLAVVRRILNLAARLWRDETDRPWLTVAPLIQMERHRHAREPYPLSVTEQRLLFSELEGHLASMALFKVNTGLREREVVHLRWQWEWHIPELGTSVFVIPRDYVKNALDRHVVLNRIARSVIASCRGRHPEYVFTRNGSPVTHIYNSGWKAARRRAAARYEHELGRPCPAGFRSIRVHDLKHAFGFRLRVAGCELRGSQAPPRAQGAARDDPLLGTGNRLTHRGGGKGLRSRTARKSRHLHDTIAGLNRPAARPTPAGRVRRPLALRVRQRGPRAAAHEVAADAKLSAVSFPGAARGRKQGATGHGSHR